MLANSIWVGCYWNYIILLHYYRPQTKFGEVMFSQASVCLSTRGGGGRGVGNIKYIIPLATSTGGGNWHFARTASKRAVCILLKCCLKIYYYFECSAVHVNKHELNWIELNYTTQKSKLYHAKEIIIPCKRMTHFRQTKPCWICLMRLG